LRIQDTKVSVKKPFNEFETDFSAIQRIQSIRRKLHLALPILDSILNILVSLTTEFEMVGQLMSLDLPIRNALHAELVQVWTEMKSHRSTAHGLLKISDDLRLTVRV
jgi:hypothetical protein